MREEKVTVSLQQHADARRRRLRLPAEAGIAFVLVLLLIVGSLATPNFLTVSNMFVLLLNGAVIGFDKPKLTSGCDVESRV